MYRQLVKVIFVLTIVCAAAWPVFAEDEKPAPTGPIDQWGKIDTIYAELAKVSEKVWTITVGCTNDEALSAFSIPLHYTAGKAHLVADSAVFTTGRASAFDIKSFRCDTAIQVIMIGMIGSMGPVKKTVEPGTGALATVYLSSLDIPIQKLKVDTCTAAPNNTLMAIADQQLLGIPADSLTPDKFQKLILVPAYVVREPKK
ncbi:MAG: hypothetical protein AAB305_07550 [Candidatus Zixiibacteriota bacterium]